MPEYLGQNGVYAELEKASQQAATERLVSQQSAASTDKTSPRQPEAPTAVPSSPPQRRRGGQ